MTIRTYFDPLHHGITLDPSIPEEKMIMDLIDSTPFQRLRRIRQLGPASLTFHGAESSRFTHSLGVFHIARRAFSKLVKIDSSLNKFRGIVYGSALLHDLGHGPLSHTSEEIFGLNHENWSSKIIKEHKEVKEPLKLISSDTPDSIASIISGKFTTRKIIKTLISSQLDCDRLDYLLRDSYTTGTKFGQLDLDRIISAMTIAPDGDLAIHPKGLIAVEHYLVVRNLMYRSVYNHRLNEVSSWLLMKIIETARDLGPKKVWTDKCIQKWLWEPEGIDLEIFLANDDIRTGYHLSKWAEDSPPKLAELCWRFLNRRLLKAININHFDNETQLIALAIARKLSKQSNQDPDQCCGISKKKIKNYVPYQGGLRLWNGSKLQAIENISPLIKTLTEPIGTSWLIYPKEISNALKKELSLLIEGKDIPLLSNASY